MRPTEQPGSIESTQEYYHQEVQCPQLSRSLQSIYNKNTRIKQDNLKQKTKDKKQKTKMATTKIYIKI